MATLSFSLTAGGFSFGYLLLHGSTLSGSTSLPAAANATNVVGPVAPAGGTFELLVDEGANATHPFILKV